MIVYKEIGEITPEIWQHEFLARVDAPTESGPLTAAPAP
jgi:hypothetical protein